MVIRAGILSISAVIITLWGCGDDGGGSDGGDLGGEGAACSTTAECQVGLVCADGVCTAGGAAELGEACSLTRECRAKLYCVAATCVNEQPAGACWEDADCVSGQSCRSNACFSAVDGGRDASTDGAADTSVADAGADADGGGGLPPTPASCLAYCGLVIGNCIEGLSQFADFGACMSHCEGTSGWTQGELGATSGNTLSCRTTYAERAEGDPNANCYAAGPSGGNVCGSWCEVYCVQVETNCTAANAIAFDPDCATVCADYPADGLPLATNRDSVQCRIYHSGSPAGANPALHCPHASPEPTEMCVDPDPVP